MTIEIISGYDIKRMFDAALVGLTDRYKEIDALNVFPVPDGDTGTNMYLTLTSAVNEAAGAKDPSSVSLVAEAAARGALMGARGNSGVILSQLLRGFAQGLKNYNQVNSTVFAQALEEGVKVAFKAIIKPVEGTILSVAKEAARAARKTSGQNLKIADLLQITCDVAADTLRNTPKMLPALAEAGVVDAGGMGWLVILQGFYTGVSGEPENSLIKTTADQIVDTVAEESPEAYDLEFPYCTEILVDSPTGIKGLQESLERLGDSLMIADSGGITRVHVHSDHPGQVIETCLRYGHLKDVKVTNMMEQAAQTAGKVQTADEPPVAVPGAESNGRPFGIVSVAMGEGIKNVMINLGADITLTGGQTMNPSTQELLTAVEQLSSETVVILPNNRNIIMTANQLAALSDKKIVVIPTRSIPQGLAALLAVTPGPDPAKTFKDMNEACGRVKTGDVTYAVRDTRVNDQAIGKGDIIGLYDDEIVVSGSDLNLVVTELLQKMITPDNEICSLYYGDKVSSQEAQVLLDQLEQRFPELEFELISGDQPLYYYIISLE